MNTVAMDPMLTWMQVFALAAAGVVFALLGSIKIPLARQLNIDEAKVGGLISVFGVTWIPMVFAAGILAEIVGKQAVLGAGFVLVIISLLMLANLKSYGAVLFAVLALGTGWSAQVNVLNVTTPSAFLPERRRRAGPESTGPTFFAEPCPVTKAARGFKLHGRQRAVCG